MRGTMQDWDLRVPHLIDYAAREHGTREIVTRWTDGTMERTNWAGVAREARKLSQAFTALGLQKGDRIATFSENIKEEFLAPPNKKGQVFVKRFMPSLREAGLELFPAYTEEERAMLFPRGM